MTNMMNMAIRRPLRLWEPVAALAIFSNGGLQVDTAFFNSLLGVCLDAEGGVGQMWHV